MLVRPPTVRRRDRVGPTSTEFARCCATPLFPALSWTAMLTRGREAQARGSPSNVLSPLPRCFIRAVFLLLPADQRLRCVEVNRAWRALLADTSFWIFLDLSTSSGLTSFSEALFRAAVAKAGGQLRALDVSGRIKGYYGTNIEQIPFDVLRAAVASNAASLTELRVYSPNNSCLQVSDMQLLLHAAPLLQHFAVGVVLCYNMLEASAMLRNKAPFGARRLQYIHIYDLCSTGWPRGQAGWASFCADVGRHASLDHLGLVCAPVHTTDAMGALVDACISIRLRSLRLHDCSLTPAVVAPLTRLVAAGALRELSILEIQSDSHGPFTPDAETQLFCAAVRASKMTKFELRPNSIGGTCEVAAFIKARSQGS